MKLSLRSGLSLLALSLILSQPSLAQTEAQAHQNPPVEAAQSDGMALPFKIGKLDLFVLHDTQFVMPNNNKVFVIDQTQEAVSAVLQKAGAPTDTITLSVDTLLLKDGKRLILMDTGIGAKGGGKLIDSLALVGFSPDDVTDVLITHAHGDHVGGLVDTNGLLRFPKATIRMTKAEWAFMQTGAQTTELAKQISPKVKTFEPGSKISPAVRAVIIKGHTPGHTGYLITSGANKLLNVGDTVHSSILSLAKPEWAIGFDSDKPVAEQSRLKLLQSLSQSGEMIFSVHFPYPGLGLIKKDADAYIWQPAAQP
jgi:glyoxylase-like metal-dependent hydrolase (beta-lactamase superfamily II)